MITVSAINATASDYTLLDVITIAHSEIGLPVPVSVIGNTDQLVITSAALLRAVGMELYSTYPWALLNKELTFTTVNGQDKYTLPVDWAYFIDQTQWDRSNHWPLLGPKSAQEWQWLKGGLISQGPRTRYRVRNGVIQLHPVPGTSSATMAMEYISNCWVTDNANVNAKSYFTLDTDKFYIDGLLLIKYLKYKIKASKGFDATDLLSEFTTYYSELVGKDKGGPILTLAANPLPMLINAGNIPDGSWQIGP